MTEPSTLIIPIAFAVLLGASAPAGAAMPRPSLGGISGGSVGIVAVTPDPETVPNPPFVRLVWRTTDTVKIELTDKSHVETGFRVEHRTGVGAWESIETFGALVSTESKHTLEATSLTPSSEHCFRVFAVRQTRTEVLEDFLVERCARTPSRSCPASTLEALTTYHSAGPQSVVIQCDVHLFPTSRITNRVIIEGSAASGIVFDLGRGKIDGGTHGGNMLEVRSKGTLSAGDPPVLFYFRPENVTVRNGEIIGAVRIWGMAQSGEGTIAISGLNEFRESSRRSGHTARAQMNAPTNITLENLTITGTGRNPLYFAPGVTNSRLVHSEIRGVSSRVAVYLDAETAEITLEGNLIHVQTADGTLGFGIPNPQVALDGSARNLIINNTFSALHNGGIYAYRNCGDNGVVRHQTPSHNQIVNNWFYYNQYGPRYVSINGQQVAIVNPAVYLGSRDWTWWEDLIRYCDEDDGFAFGSGASDLDHATHNVVMQNQIYENSVHEMVVVHDLPTNHSNVVAYNETVTPQTVDLMRSAGCHVANEAIDFLVHGQTYDSTIANGVSIRYTCTNGRLSVRLLAAGSTPLTLN